jgi:hypothetical protein
MSKGFVVWEGASPVDGAPIVMIMTMSTTNRKTGDMVQTWILRQDISPVEAIKSGEDASICGSCVHRGSAERGRSCYVNVGQAPLSVWRKYQRGGYQRFTRKDWGLLRGRKVRFGAYGDPGMVPLDRLALLARLSDGWTGYTHQWRAIEEGYADYLMASADSHADYLAARGKGYRSFIVIPKGSAKPEGSVLCMSVARGTSCLDCGACAGTREGAVKGAVSIFIEAHGTGAKYVTA